MIRDVLTLSANSLWSQISLIIFVLCFVGILIWTIAGRRSRFARQSTLPLEDGVLQQGESAFLQKEIKND
jgi:cbb3-type cytochrome oxidase subunit 3